MKILFVNDYSTKIGGAEIIVSLLKEELEKRGHEVQIFTSSAAVESRPLNPDYTCLGTLSRFRTYLQVANFSAYFRLKQLLSQWQPDLIHISIFLTQLSPLILPLLKDYPVLWHLHWYRGICPIGTKSLPSGEICKFDYGESCVTAGCLPVYQWVPLMWQMKYLEKYKFVFRRIVAVSDFVKTAFEAVGYTNINVIHNVTRADARHVCAKFNLKPIVVFAGRLVKVKGVDFLLRAFAKVKQSAPEAILKIAGAGIERKNLETLTAALKLQTQVEFLGQISSDRLEIQFADAWVQVVPSIWDEPFGLTVIEGMQRGTPIVATKSGGITELISHRNTGLLTAATEDELAECILQLIQDRQLRENIRHNALEFVREYSSVDRFVDKFLAIYRDML